jgi:protein arginine kinase
MSVYSPSPTQQQAPHEDVVISSRVRIARNLAGFAFVNRATAAQCQRVLDASHPVILGLDMPGGMMWVDLDKSTSRDRRLLFERHLISKHLEDSDHRRSVAISGDESLSIMVNEEDHLRMQVLERGLRLDGLHTRLNAIDDAIEARLDYAFSPKWGYLTACPTNLGTGIRFSVMMHLPGLTGDKKLLEQVRNAARDLNLAVRGYHGEGSGSAGDFYQISNQITLGRGEGDLLAEFMGNIVPRIIDWERHARTPRERARRVELEDAIHRAVATLHAARLLKIDEAMKLLSKVRLGICTGRVNAINLDTITELFLLIQPAHLRAHMKVDLEGDALREARATVVRKRLGG